MNQSKDLDYLWKKCCKANSFSFPQEIRRKDKRVFMMMPHQKDHSSYEGMLYPI